MKTKLRIRKPLQIIDSAHKALPRLCDMLAQEKGVSSVSMTDAASIAIQEAIARRQEAAKQVTA